MHNFSVLAVPMLSKQEINGDSNYVQMVALLTAMLKQRPKWTFVVPWPDAHSGFKYEADGFFSNRSIVRVPQRLSTRKLSNVVTYDGLWWDQLLRTFACQITWTNVVEIAHHLRYAGHAGYGDYARPITIAAHHYVIHKTLPYPIDAMYGVLLSQIVGAIGADWNVFNSEHCRRMFFENLFDVAGGNTIDDIRKKSSLIYLGVLEDEIKPIEREPNPEPIIIYNHRLQNYKKWTETFDVLDELHKEGLKFRVRFTGATNDNVNRIRKYPWVEIRLCPTRREYLDAIKGGDLNVINSVHETFCISAIESMAFGQPLVAPDGITFPEITGRDDTQYPYLFKTREQQKAMLFELLSNHEKRERWGAVLSRYVLKHFNRDLWAAKYIALFEQLEDAIDLNPKEKGIKAFGDVLTRRKEWPMRELLNALYAIDLKGSKPFAGQSLPPAKMVRYVCRLFGAHVELRQGHQWIVNA